MDDKRKQKLTWTFGPSELQRYLKVCLKIDPVISETKFPMLIFTNNPDRREVMTIDHMTLWVRWVILKNETINKKITKHNKK